VTSVGAFVATAWVPAFLKLPVSRKPIIAMVEMSPAIVLGLHDAATILSVAVRQRERRLLVQQIPLVRDLLDRITTIQARLHGRSIEVRFAFRRRLSLDIQRLVITGLAGSGVLLVRHGAWATQQHIGRNGSAGQPGKSN
jgi:hypothetical protein